VQFDVGFDVSPKQVPSEVTLDPPVSVTVLPVMTAEFWPIDPAVPVVTVGFVRFRMLSA
jgi:hypothetical protein